MDIFDRIMMTVLFLIILIITVSSIITLDHRLTVIESQLKNQSPHIWRLT